MTFLLDVNVLIALIDPGHIQHDAAHRWFGAEGKAGFATCPLTENGALRIVGHPRYPGSPGSPAAVAPAVANLRTLPGHSFWPNDLSLLDARRLDAGQLLRPGQITDTYLLALAVSRQGRLATFDRKMSLDAVDGGREAFHLIA